MNFKEAIEHYRSNTATAEEKRVVEEELEKNRLISDYLEELFVDEQAIQECSEAEADFQKVKHTLRKRSIILVATAVLSVIILALLKQYVISPLLNQRYYNPTIKTLDTFASDFDISMAAYTELHHAGYVYSGSIVDHTGIGSYSLTLMQFPLNTGKNEYIEATLEKNKLKLPHSFSSDALPVNVFARASYPTYPLDANQIDGMNKQLSALPDYVKVTAAVSFSEDLSMEQLIELMRDRKDTSVIWIGVRNAPEDKQRFPLCGLDPTSIGAVLDRINDSYPAFELSMVTGHDFYTAEDYTTHFESLLAYLKDHPDFLNAMNSEAGTAYDMSEYYKEVLDYVVQNGVNSYGVMVIGSPQALLSLYDTGHVSQIWPLDANIAF